MGILVTQGVAKGYFDTDTVVFDISFDMSGDDKLELMERTETACEEFLKSLLEVGISPDRVELMDAGVSERYKSNNYIYETSRHLEIRMELTNKACATLFELCKKHSKDILYKVSYELEDDEKIKKQLLQKAATNAREQADLIAASLGKEVIGIKSINRCTPIDRVRYRRALVKSMEIEIPQFLQKRDNLTDQAGLPQEKREISFDITWIISD